jgi:hypothetical protein
MLTNIIAKLTGEIIVPLTKKGKKMMSSMKKQYGTGKKGESVFYATVRKKKLKGMERKKKK